jgi:hypothetical protein
MFDDLIWRMLRTGGSKRKAMCFAYGVVKGLIPAGPLRQMARLAQEHGDALSTRSDFINHMRYFDKASRDLNENVELRKLLWGLTDPGKETDWAVGIAQFAHRVRRETGFAIVHEDEIIRVMEILIDLFDPTLFEEPTAANLACRRSEFRLPVFKTLDRQAVLANDGAACNLAMGAYNEEDWGKLPILADALEEGGCTDAHVLEHLRNGKEHYRGCWALDLIFQTMKPGDRK